ncbi:cbb3-type cytochrome c oxidase subunit 3 [bacterium]|nr:cbb3-type cytochrome c oxidase subunit 3 [bacterium]
MIGKFFSHLELTSWSSLSTAFFCLLFAGIILWTWRPGSKKQYENAARIPLESDSENDEISITESCGRKGER